MRPRNVLAPGALADALTLIPAGRHHDGWLRILRIDRIESC